MKILLITQEPPLHNEEIVSGNAVRSRQLKSGLESAGHEVSQTWLSSDRKRPEGSFRNSDELQGILLEHAADTIIVSYWELLGLLPYEMTRTVVLDFVAPRPLEEMFESPETVRASMRRLRLNLERCDAVMVGNELQRHLLINTMIEAGFDLRRSNPILVVEKIAGCWLPVVSAGRGVIPGPTRTYSKASHGRCNRAYTLCISVANTDGMGKMMVPLKKAPCQASPQLNTGRWSLTRSSANFCPKTRILALNSRIGTWNANTASPSVRSSTCATVCHCCATATFPWRP